MRGWVHNAHVGGKAVSETLRRDVTARLEAYAAKRFGGRSRRDIRFRGQFCYVDLYTDPDPRRCSAPPPGFAGQGAYLEHLETTPIHVCRLRRFAQDRWSFAFYSYASRRYEPCCLATGELIGVAEDAVELSAVVHLT